MMQHRVKHLEPVYIGYINEWKHALVTEDGSKFYPNDLVYHKAMDTMYEKLDEEDKELVILWNKALPIVADPSKKSSFYLNEKEFDDYCAQSLNFLENMDSAERRLMRAETLKNLKESEFYDCDQIEVYFHIFPKEFRGSGDEKKIRENFKRRGASNGKGLNGLELVRTMTMLKLAGMNISKGVDNLINLRRYQKFNKERKVLVRIMSDRRTEDYDDWEMCCEEMLEVFCSILGEEGRLSPKLSNLQKWNASNHLNNLYFASVTEFKQMLTELEIDHSRITLVPDIHFIRQWFQLPLLVDYTCATVLRPDGEEYYRPIQAQLYVFEKLACDIDWEAAAKKNSQKTLRMRNRIIALMEHTQERDLFPPKVLEDTINQISTDSFFAESRKRAMKAPLYICRKKNYNDTMPISEFKQMFKLYYREVVTTRNEFWKKDKIEMWKVRHLFLVRWIEIVLSGHRKLANNLTAAITMQIGFIDLKDADDMTQYYMSLNMEHFIDYSRIEVFEKMAENSRIKTLDAPKQKLPQEPPKKQNKKKVSSLKRVLDKVDEKKAATNIAKKDSQTTVGEIEVAPKKKCEVANETNEVSTKEAEVSTEESKKIANDQSPEKTLEEEAKIAEVEPEVVDVKKCPCGDEIEILKRQLAEKSKLLEDQSKSDAMRIQQLQSELEKSKNMMAQQEENAKEVQKTLRDQANKIKQDYKAENQKLKQSLENKENRIKQLDMELKESRENAKNERKKMNSEADSESRITDKTIKKMKAELEMAKLTEKTCSKKIDKLEKENGQLKTQLEILEEQRSTDSEKEKRIQELTRKCEDLQFANMELSADVEEASIKNQEFEKLASKNHELMAEIDRMERLSLELEMKNCEPLPCSKCSSINVLQNESDNIRDCPICIDDIDHNDQNVRKCESCRADYHGNCLSEWLNINPNLSKLPSPLAQSTRVPSFVNNIYVFVLFTIIICFCC